MEDIEQQPPPAAGAGQAPPHTHQQLVKLPGFWTEDPVSWFRLAEGQFALRNVTDPVARYYHVLASLSATAATPSVIYRRIFANNPSHRRPVQHGSRHPLQAHQQLCCGANSAPIRSRVAPLLWQRRDGGSPTSSPSRA
jgi:hypothetical protein